MAVVEDVEDSIVADAAADEVAEGIVAEEGIVAVEEEEEEELLVAQKLLSSHGDDTRVFSSLAAKKTCLSPSISHLANQSTAKSAL